MPCTGLWFIKPPGIRPCPLYTPPVALTDGLPCEFEGLIKITLCSFHWKLKRTVWSKGKRSRNKASVGEPADGSLRFIYIYHICINIIQVLFLYIILYNIICCCCVCERKKERKKEVFYFS